MDDSKKRTLIMAVVFLVIGLGYYGYTYFFGPERPPAPTQDESASASDAGDDGDGPDATRRAADLATRLAQRRLVTVRGEGYQATIDNVGGGVKELLLVGDPRFTEDGRPLNIVSTDREEYQPFRVILSRLGLPDDLVWQSEQVSDREARLTWEGRGVRIVRTFVAGETPYQLFSTVEVTNTGNRPRRTRLEVANYHYVRRDDEGGGFFGMGGRSPKIGSAVCVFGDETERIDRGKLAPDGEAPVPHGYGGGDVHVAAVESAYFVQAAAADGEPAARCGLYGSNKFAEGSEDADGTLFESRLIYGWDTIEPGATRTWRTLGYLGPKLPAALEAAGHQLPEMVDLGFFSLIAGQLARLLGFIHGFVPNWGLAIILLTLMIRLVLFPLTNMSFNSMSRMRLLKPEIDRINELYADDAEKKGAAIMELYRKHKINPVSGCLPMLLQLPVWWALYTSLSSNIELYHMPFALWWTDLSAPDPYFVLPLALGALMHLQQRLTPTTADPMQAKMMMWFMPIMITVFMLFLPSGLCLYMLTNSALGIAQQKVNEMRMAKQQPAPAEAAAPTDDEGPDDEGSDDDSSSNDPQRRPKRKRIRRARRG